MSFFATASRACAFTLGAAIYLSTSAFALDLDWHGQFRAEENVIFGYQHGTKAAPNNGYTVPSNGDSPATFQDLFLRLKPRVLVNDNVSLHSDTWFGAPDTGLFGSDAGSKSYYVQSTTTGNATLSAHTLFAEIASDFGTVRVGRLPLNWGLGLIWNAKDTGFDRLPSNGDGISMTTKLGSFRFSPAIIKYQNGNYSGVNTNTTTLGTGNAGVSDYTAALTYTNDDEKADLGILFMRRIAGVNANVINPFSITTPTTYGYAYNVWDFYAKKKTGVVTVALEVPLISGFVAGRDYSTVAGAVKADAQLNEKWNAHLNLGSASGQDGDQNKLKAFSFHPDYRPGFLMFNYNYRNIATGAGSPYDNPVTNTQFLSLGVDYTTGKWMHGLQGLYARADKSADGTAGNLYFNQYDRHMQVQTTNTAQEKDLGVEFDYRLTYAWDEMISFSLDTGLYFPGKFYDYNNTAVANDHKTIFGSDLSVLVQF